MIRRAALPVALVVAWIALWGNLSWANVVSGVAMAALVMVLSPAPPHERVGQIRPLDLIWLLLFFHWKLLEASAIVAWEVVTPKNRINQAIVAVHVRGTSDVLTTVVANAISLTPGTITVEVRTDPTVLYVHLLHLRSVEAVRRDVLHLEELVIRALGSDEALRLLDQDIARIQAQADEDAR